MQVDGMLHSLIEKYKNESTQYVRVGDDTEIPKGFLSSVQIALRRYGFIGSLSRYLMMMNEHKKFVNRATSYPDKVFRTDLIKKFSLIQKHIPCAHSPYQFVQMAEYLLNLEISGPIVQCGCFKGGSTAKLSLLAKKLNRCLYVCDSFQGLPEPSSKKELFLQGHGDHPSTVFSPGQYKGTPDEVKRNVKEHGCIDVCEFVPGFFEDSLKALDINPAFVFIDVDYVSSARDCLKYLWPRLKLNGYWFTHEAIYLDYIFGILDTQWWLETLGEYPPVIMGGGYGLSVLSPWLAYFKKLPKN